MDKQKDDKRRDEALRRALNMPPQPKKKPTSESDGLKDDNEPRDKSESE
tara:strand:+ start:722 stop:868 length:147 start_codon:yes stop_codon:yes gene_type:complete